MNKKIIKIFKYTIKIDVKQVNNFDILFNTEQKEKSKLQPVKFSKFKLIKYVTLS